MIVKQVYKLIGYKPGHPIVLSEIFRSHGESLTIEIPVWKQIKKRNRYFIGHIDLLVISGSKLIIADYKGDKAEIFKLIPQITAYAIMLNERLKIPQLNLKCVLFSKTEVWEFDPFVVKDELINFLKFEKEISKRRQEIFGENKNKALREEIELLILVLRKLK